MGMFWPSIQTEEDAKKASKQAAYLCFFVGIVTAVVAFLHINKTLDLFPGMDASAYIDAAAFIVIGIFLLRYSRIAALVGLGLYILEQVVMIQEHGFHFNITAIVIMLGLLSAVRATFAYHDMKAGKQSVGGITDAGMKKMEKAAKVIFVIAILAGLSLGAVWTYSQYQKKNAEMRVFQRSASPLPNFKLPQIKIPNFEKKPAGAALPVKTLSGPAQTFRLRDGRTISGAVVYEDETYYTVDTLTGQEIVIKQDIEK